MLANGLGGTFFTFCYLYEALTDYRVLCWDYRGLYTSGAPRDPRANTVAHQCDDLAEIMAKEGIAECVLAGWSMGVQLGFELMRRQPGRVRGMLAINGTSGHPFHTIMGSRLVGHTIPMLLRLVRAQAELASRATRLLAGRDSLIAAMKRIGLVSDTIDIAIFRAVAAGFQTVDWTIYSHLLTRLNEHDAEAVLPTIDVPVSIISADGDLMTPPAVAERLHRTIRGSRLVVIDGGTHYTPVEYPAIVVDELHRLLDRVHGWERA